MSRAASLSRRDFIKVSYAAGVGLLVSIYLPGCSEMEPTATPRPTAMPTLAGPEELEPDIYFTIGHDGIVTVRVFRSELGQGVRTSLPMILAEELDADWKSVRIEQVDANSQYGNQSTGGSVSVSAYYTILRRAGAVGRDLLVTAAAQLWDVAKDGCATENGEVINQATGERLSYGYLVPLAASLPAPKSWELPLKSKENFRIIGKRLARLDGPDIVTGKAVFSMDVRLPGMLYAVVAHNPSIRGSITEFDDSRARAVAGVRRVLRIESGVAVVAESTWSALQGREALEFTFDDSFLKEYNSAADAQELLSRATTPPGENELAAYYTMPYLGHAPMEPNNCAADFRSDRCEVWAPTQSPQNVKSNVVNATGLKAEAVTVHVTLAGGAFGRRIYDEVPISYVVEAVQISQAMGTPIKLLWTREDDFQHDYFHPLSVTRVSARLDDIKTLTLRRVSASGSIPTGPWRSVENVPVAFARESFLDEYAFATHQDPLEVHRRILSERGRAVLELAAQKAGWGTPLPAGQGRGIAYHATWDATPVAQVAEVSVDSRGQVRVQRVVCAVDCGVVINPDMVEAQMEGGIIFGLTAALKASISIEKGRVQQSNFHDYPLLRLDEIPAIEVYIVPSDEAPSGIGEMANPVIMPAVANAVFAATGKRIRHVPIKPEDILSA